MASIVLTQLICDSCGEVVESEGAHYEIRQGTRRRGLDFCKEDAKVVEDLMELARSGPGVAAASQRGAVVTPRQRRARKLSATSVEEIEASKTPKPRGRRKAADAPTE